MAQQLKTLKYLGYAFAAGKVLGAGVGFFQKRADKKLKSAIEKAHRSLTSEYLAADPNNRASVSSVDPALVREAKYYAETGKRSTLSTQLGLGNGPLGTS